MASLGCSRTPRGRRRAARRDRPHGERGRAGIGRTGTRAAERTRRGRTKPGGGRRTGHALARCQYPPFPRSAGKNWRRAEPAARRDRPHGGRGRRRAGRRGTQNRRQAGLGRADDAGGRRDRPHGERGRRSAGKSRRQAGIGLRSGCGRARRGRGGQDMRAPNTERPAVGKAGRGYRTPDSPAPPRRFALEESPAHVKHGPDRPRRASSPAHAAYTPMMLRTPTLFTPAGTEKAHAAADGSGAYQMADRRSAKHAPHIIPRARRHTRRCCRTLRPPSRQPAQQQVPQAGGSGLRRRGLRRFDHAQRKARAARPPPRTPHTRR